MIVPKCTELLYFEMKWTAVSDGYKPTLRIFTLIQDKHNYTALDH